MRGTIAITISDPWESSERWGGEKQLTILLWSTDAAWTLSSKSGAYPDSSYLYLSNTVTLCPEDGISRIRLGKALDYDGILPFFELRATASESPKMPALPHVVSVDRPGAHRDEGEGNLTTDDTDRSLFCHFRTRQRNEGLMYQDVLECGVCPSACDHGGGFIISQDSWPCGAQLNTKNTKAPTGTPTEGSTYSGSESPDGPGGAAFASFTSFAYILSFTTQKCWRALLIQLEHPKVYGVASS